MEINKLQKKDVCIFSLYNFKNSINLFIFFGISMYYGIYYKSLIYWIIPVIHLIFNLSFTPVMFGANNLLAAFIITLFTLITSLIIIWQFYTTKSNIISIYLLIPYVLWLSFATYLAYDIYIPVSYTHLTLPTNREV